MAIAKLEMLVGLQDDVSKGLESIGGALETVGSAAAVATEAVVAAAAAAVAYAGVAVTQFARVGDEIAKMGIRTGISTESISAFRVAAGAAGTSLAAVESGIKLMQKSMSDLSGDTKKGQEAFAALGLSFTEVQKMKPDEQFAKIGAAIASLPSAAERTAAAMALFGRSGTDLIPLFGELGGSLEAAKQKAIELGVSFDQVSADKAQELNDAMGYLKEAFLGISLAVGGELAPTITKLIDDALPSFQVFAQWLGGVLPPLIEKIIQGFGSLADAAGKVWKYLEDTGVISAFTSAWQSVSEFFVTNIPIAVAATGEAFKTLKADAVALWAFLRDTGVFDALKAAVIFLWNAFVDELIPALQALENWIAVRVTPALIALKENIQANMGPAVGVVTAIFRVFAAALGMLWTDIVTKLAPAFGQLLDAIRPHFPMLKQLAEFIGAFVVVTLLALIAVIDLVVKILAAMISAIATAIVAWQNFKENLNGVWNDIKAYAKTVWDSIVAIITGAIATVTKPISDLISSIQAVSGAVGNSFKNLPANLGITKRASGGPVDAGGAYLVGEGGPELFVPGQSGMIVPAGAAMGGGGSVTLVVSGNTFLGDPSAAALAIGDELVKYLKRNIRL